MMSNTDHHLNSKLMVGLLFGGLGVWGIYLAIGAAGFFSPVTVVDSRKFFVVLTCSAVFLAFWYANVRLSRSTRFSQSGADVKTSRACWLSLVCSTLAYGLWAVAFAMPDTTAVILGYLSAGLLGIGVIAALVGLSDPKPKNGKWAGMLSVFLFVMSIVLFFVQVHVYFSQTL